MNRISSPNAAFAYVGKINGVEFKLLRHHSLDSVKDGNEHETVDKSLLIACWRMIDQLPVGATEREEIRKHLASHASFFQLDLADPGVAQRLINQKDSGHPQLGVKEINRIEDNGEIFEPPIELTPKNSQSKVILDDGELPVDNPNKDKTDGDPKSPPAGGNDKVIHKDENSQEVANPNKDKMGKASVQVEDSKKNEVVDNAEAIHKMGKPHKTSKKVKKSKKKTSVYGFALSDIVRNKESGKFAIVSSVKDNLATIHYAGTRESMVIGEKDADKWEIIAHASSQSGEKINLEKGLTVVGSDEDLARATMSQPKSMPVPATPTLEEQNKKGGKVFLEEDQEKLTENPNKDKMGKASLLYASVNDLTEEGRKLIINRFGGSLKGKVAAKIFAVEKVGTVEFVNLQLGEDKDFPMHVMMDIARDGEGAVTRVRIINESLPSEVLTDLAKFFNDLSKSKASEVDLATAPAKLERCVADVLSKKVEEYKKKNGKAPSAKLLEKMKSSAFAICNASLK